MLLADEEEEEVVMEVLDNVQLFDKNNPICKQVRAHYGLKVKAGIEDLGRDRAIP